MSNLLSLDDYRAYLADEHDEDVLEALNETRVIVPCSCAEPSCRGWALYSPEMLDLAMEEHERHGEAITLRYINLAAPREPVIASS